MKMLTGLLPASEGEARLFGQPVDPKDIATRQRVGYMSQAFSLYSERPSGKTRAARPPVPYSGWRNPRPGGGNERALYADRG